MPVPRVSREVPVELFGDYVNWLIAAGLLQIAGAAACAWLAWRGKREVALILLAGSGLVFAQLALSGHGFTDAGLGGLARLAKLRSLRLFETGVTTNGVAVLKRQLPQLQVEAWGRDAHD